MPRALNHFRSIRSKLTVIIIASTVIAVVVAALALGWQMADRRSKALLSELDGVAVTIATAVAPAQADKSYHLVMRTLSAIGRMPRIEYAQIIEPDGELIARFGNGIVLERDAALVSQTDKPTL
ncbi:MAG: hypothetical protein AAFO75_11895, partial [Pseudomonadota bacterium]